MTTKLQVDVFDAESNLYGRPIAVNEPVRGLLIYDCLGRVVVGGIHPLTLFIVAGAEPTYFEGMPGADEVARLLFASRLRLSATEPNKRLVPARCGRWLDMLRLH
jgi:hypothetical protein